MQQITIDPEFQALIPPLSAEERAQLEANLLADGCRDPLVVWPLPMHTVDYSEAQDGSDVETYVWAHAEIQSAWHEKHGEETWRQWPTNEGKYGDYLLEEDWPCVLIDGHNRHEICTRLGLPFEVVQREFADREEAMDWIDANQLGRRNLSPEERTRLIGRRYNRAKRQGARTDLTSGQSGTKLQTAERIAAEHGVSPRTVKRAGQYDEAATVIEQAGGTVAGADQQAVVKAAEVVRQVPEAAQDVELAADFARLPDELKQDALEAIAVQAPAAEVMREAVKKAHVANNSGNNEWYTPADYIALAREVMGGIDTDPATSEIANRTVQASQIFTAEDNGLTKQWSGFKWLNPAPCNCGVAPKPIESGDGYENLPELSKSLAAHVGLLLAENGDAISGFLVQRLLPRKGQEAPSRTPRRPGAAVEVVGREGEVQQEPEGHRGKAFAEPYRQSEAAGKDYRNGLGVDCGGVEPDAGGMGARLCLLREDGSAVDAGSLHSYLSSCIAGDGARKHGACLPELQFQQGAPDAGRVARGQAAYCPNCGVAGYALVTPSRVFLNPPYAQPLISEFAEAIASKYESGEIEQACVLVNNGTETAWFQRMLRTASAVCFPRSRIRFVDPEGNPSGAPLQGQAVLYLGDETETFASVFSEKGAVLFNA